ncbi:hypothetical protein D917_05039 [Trichinella nativa]|uniref:Uncharacterized protein n=1 Tax=Trichinella nativa TaxID=6335 RepID=A0A1Y3EXB2_9BILA|nr:hypothetical protein D917_05039 [Trichinella nativa]
MYFLLVIFSPVSNLITIHNMRRGFLYNKPLLCRLLASILLNKILLKSSAAAGGRGEISGRVGVGMATG